MAKIQYLNKRLSEKKLALIDLCNEIIATYQAQNLRLTLRQLYYRLVARGVIPNIQSEYKNLGDVLNDARLCGLIDWDAIEDRTRELGQNSHWDTPSNIIESARDSYLNDLWKFQPIRPEVWVEKDALEGVIEAACRPLDVPFFSCRGYTSQTAMWEAGQRILRRRRNITTYEGEHKRKNGNEFRQRTLIFHLGDHDPSGIDMTRDITDRLELFNGAPVEIRRLALNMPQIDKYNPPPNPAKTTDSRFRSYQEKHGDESWELDALDPNVLIALIQSNIRSVMDVPRFEEAKAIQEKGRTELTAIAEKYDKAVKAVLGKSGK